MLMLTAKVDKKKILFILGAAALVLVLLFSCGRDSGGKASLETASTTAQAGSNEDRVKFLTDFGWDVTASPVESMQVRIPKESNDVYSRYNSLQLSQGYDLTQYAGKSVMRYVYQINNFPNATGEVYATVLVYKDQINGGDITDTSPGGKVQGFAMQPGSSVPPQTTVPAA